MRRDGAGSTLLCGEEAIEKAVPPNGLFRLSDDLLIIEVTISLNRTGRANLLPLRTYPGKRYLWSRRGDRIVRHASS